MQTRYIGDSAAPLRPSEVLYHIHQAIGRGREIAARQNYRVSDSDACHLDMLDGIRESRNVKIGTRDSKIIRDQYRHAVGLARLGDAIWMPAADASYTVPEAQTAIYGPPIAPMLAPLTLIKDFPTAPIPAWADSVRMDYFTYTGQVSFGRASNTGMPVSDYEATSYYSLTPEIAWTTTEIDWRQEQVAQAPGYIYDPAAKRAESARYNMERAIENSIIRTPTGTAWQSLDNTPCFRARSSLVYGTSAVELCVEDLFKATNLIGELSKGVTNPNALATTERVWNSLFAKVTTAGGFPFEAEALVRRRLSEKGITRIIIAPSLQDFGGVNIDPLIFMSTDPNGLKRHTAMPFTAIRTTTQGLGTQTIYAQIEAGLFAPWRASTYIYEVEITPS